MMIRTIIVAFALISITGSATVKINPKFHRINPNVPGGRIVGGHPTAIENHPWQVSVQFIGMHSCGGSIISDKVILTAGHCLQGSYPGLTQVMVGTNKTLGGAGVLHRVADLVTHEDFYMTELGVPVNDVALIILENPIKFNKAARPVPLFNQDENVEEGVVGTITGWGSLSENGKAPTVLNAVDVPIISKAKCDAAYRVFGGIPDGQICTGYAEGGKDSCQGDSGGPLVIGGRQAGIISWGNGCAREGYPGVNTEIATFRNWIANKAGI